MTPSHLGVRLAALGMVVLLLAAPAAGQATGVGDDDRTGRVVEFPITQFRDTLFAAVDASFRVAFDDEGDLWYTTEAGLVHVDPDAHTRELFTSMEGLPSSYSLGLAVAGGKAYVATDLGLGVVDVRTGEVEAKTPQNSPLPDQILQEVAVVGDEVWMGTRFFGVAIWNPATDEWRVHNTSTTAGYASPVRRIVATEGAVWIATENDGAWRHDRATGAFEAILPADGLLSRDVSAVAERAGEVWFGTDKGLQRWRPDRKGQPDEWRTFNESHGLPDRRVTDLDVIPTTQDTLDLFASTREGVWQLDPDTGRNATRSQGFGILGAYVFDNAWSDTWGWAFATNRGVSLNRAGDWSYYTTGPTQGATQGPLSFMFTSASVGDSGRFLWFGARSGVSAYRLPDANGPGWWQNFGEWQKYPGSVVNWIDTDGNVTWIGSNSGAYGFEHDTGRWIPKLSVNSRNLVYGLEADRGEIWIALFGDGLVMQNLTTGVQRTWDHRSPLNPLPDQYLTDVRADGDTIWLGAGIGVIRMDRTAGSILGTYTKADGIPGDGVVFRTLPDGPVVWIGTKEGGVARFDVATGKVTRVWNSTLTPGFPEGQVRSLHREGGRLWVGTTGGLARIDVTTGAVKAWTQADSGLVQNYVNGVSHADGILYLATLSGVARLDLATEEFLPMRDGPGVVRGAAATAGGATAGRVSVRIDSPRDGGAVYGVHEVRGSALQLGGRVDRVEVRVGDGPWQPTQGTESWTFRWDTTDLPPNEPVTIAARAFSGGNASAPVEILVTPVALPKVPLDIEGLPPGDAVALRPLKVSARVQGDEPLSATLYYRASAGAPWTKLPLSREGALHSATIPGKDVKEGELQYYLEARSGLLVETDPADPARPHALAVAAPPRLAVSVEAPPLVVATAGVPAEFELNVTNVGSEPASFTLTASGARASWVSLPPGDLDLGPGESALVRATLSAPLRAFADNTTLTFEARDAAGRADPARAEVPVRILSSASDGMDRQGDGPGGRLVPLPAPAWTLAALAAAVLLARRRRSA